MYKFLIPLFALALLIGCTPKTNNTTDQTSSTSSMESSTAMQSSVSPSGFDGQLLTGKHTVVLKTSEGDITVELDADKAPKAVTNFVMLSKMGYYNGLTFHRIKENFMIQGGDPEGTGRGGQSIFGETFEDEITDMPFQTGTIAMANRGPNTNGSQFFITVAPTPWLQGNYTIFGYVTAGMDVVNKISKMETDSTIYKKTHPDCDMPGQSCGNDLATHPATFSPEVQE